MSAVSLREADPEPAPRRTEPVPSGPRRGAGVAPGSSVRRLPGGPRLLLPPIPRPTTPRPHDVVLLAPDARSVLQAPTEACWPVAGPRVEPPGPLPDPTQLCGAVALAAVEALAGTRPLAQLTRWVTPDLAEQLATRHRLLAPARARPGSSVIAMASGAEPAYEPASWPIASC